MVKGKMNATIYKDILDDNLLRRTPEDSRGPGNGWRFIYQPDNSPWEHSQDNKGVAFKPPCEFPRVIQPQPRLEPD